MISTFENYVTLRKIYNSMFNKNYGHQTWTLGIRHFFLVCIFPYSAQIRQNADQKISVFGHYSRSVIEGSE